MLSIDQLRFTKAPHEAALMAPLRWAIAVLPTALISSVFKLFSKFTTDAACTSEQTAAQLLPIY